jgi:hypothetical protein
MGRGRPRGDLNIYITGPRGATMVVLAGRDHETGPTEAGPVEKLRFKLNLENRCLMCSIHGLKMRTDGEKSARPCSSQGEAG